MGGMNSELMEVTIIKGEKNGMMTGRNVPENFRPVTVFDLRGRLRMTKIANLANI